LLKDMETRFAALEEQIGTEFRNRNLLIQAVTHRSYLNEHSQHPTGHNERLEFLGDAVLEIVVTEFLFHKFPDEPEGKLTKWRSALVNGQTMAAIGEKIGLAEIMLLSRGEQPDFSSGRSRAWILADAVEAVIGALYLDQGIGPCRLFIDTHLHSRLSKVIVGYQEPKSDLQDFWQETHHITPTYRVESATGPDHARHFIVGVYSGEERLGTGEGKSKKDAERSAAQNALATIRTSEGPSLERDTSVPMSASPTKRR